MNPAIDTTWPAELLGGPLLAGLDQAARALLFGAARAIALAPGSAVYRDGDDSGGIFLVAAGAVELRVQRRGDDETSRLRIARAGDSFGEEALLAGLRRRGTACALEPSRVVEVPIPVLRRVAARGDGRALDREWRYLERAAARDLLAATALGRALSDVDAELLLDGVRLERFERGAHLYEAGDRADRGHVLVDGLVQIQTESNGATSIAAYLGRGDLFGDEDVLAGQPRSGAAVAAGDSWCAAVPAELLRTLADRNPGLLARLRRVADRRLADQAVAIGAASARSTQHVFRDLYRMQMARSLLVIDQDRCVRCGHCAWSCAQVHGTSRLVRRGDKVVTRIDARAGAPVSLLLPNTCQHCRNAACMIDCPTGAIGRDPGGEVFIRAELCTGCGHCAKSCPWDNIQLAPREQPTPGLSAEVAVKCDLCRGREAPACVESCPTDALMRLDPTRDITEVALLPLASTSIADPATSAFPRSAAASASPPRTAAGKARRAGVLSTFSAISPATSTSLAIAVAILVGALGWALHRRGGWSPSHGPGLAAGVVAALAIAALLAYAIPKRLAHRLARRRRISPGLAASARMSSGRAPSALAASTAIELRPPARSRLRGHLVAHVVLGAVAPAAVLAHAGMAWSASAGAVLGVALAAATLLGAAGALAYRAIPARLTRLERRGSLPEDLPLEKSSLVSRLYRETTGQSDLVKTIAGRVLLPYTRARLGWIALVVAGHGLTAEEARLRRRIEEALGDRATGRLDGLAPLLRTAVELRALPARRALTLALRAWHPLHIVAAAVAAALLAVHAATAILP